MELRRKKGKFMRGTEQVKWYQLDEQEVFSKLQTSEDGLSEERAQKLLETHGPNKLPEGKGVSRLKILIHQFTSPLIYILLVAALPPSRNELGKERNNKVRVNRWRKEFQDERQLPAGCLEDGHG